MEVTIGRAPDNDYVADDSSVSNKHALLLITDDETVIQDIHSANGTFVNNTRISKKKLNLSESIKLGDYILDNNLLKELVQKIRKTKQTDFTNEFDSLEDIYNKHIKRLNEVDTKSKNTLLLIRLAITGVLMLAVYLIFKEAIAMVFIGIVSTMLTNFLIKPHKIKAKKDDLMIDFASEYKCPKCKTELVSKSWKYWKTRKECPNPKCDASWN